MVSEIGSVKLSLACWRVRRQLVRRSDRSDRIDRIDHNGKRLIAKTFLQSVGSHWHRLRPDHSPQSHD
jgi:hypothetical protein